MKFLVAVLAVVVPLILVTQAQAEPEFQMVEGYGGVPLNVMTAGDPKNPGILLIHGMAQASQAFRLQFESSLADDFYLVAFDMRGHGLSGKPWQPDLLGPSQAWAGDVAAVMAVTGLDKPVVVGWSYGGFVVSDYIRHYGVDNIAGVNLVGSLGGLVPRSPFPPSDNIKEMLENSARTRSMNLNDNVVAANNTAATFYTDTMTEVDKSAQVAMGLMMPAYVRRAMAGRKLDNTDIADQVSIPVLLSRGSEDIMMPANDSEVAMDTLSDAEFSFYEDTGHLPFFQHPDRYNEELAEFARRVNTSND
ncbi:MAG: alpha/beta fold hydrolase [Alphaproteobacteria bacterium]|nr:alpha/beta fold hydrolase [Alphaproteobacteria bacterium]